MNSSYKTYTVGQVARGMNGNQYEYGGVQYPVYEWQRKTKDLWYDNGLQGIAQATTGSGKTRLAHMVMADWLKDYQDATITIIVPTIPLLDQWFVEVGDIFHDKEIGRKGDGHDDWKPQINIIVMASASKYLNQRTDMGDNHLIIVDECHRIGARYSRKALTCNHRAVLGLSATPKREDSGLEVLEPLLGKVLISYLYADALRDGVIPPFTLKAVQAELTQGERNSYDRLQRQMSNLTKSLSAKYGNGGNLVVKCQGLLAKGVVDAEIGTFLRVIREQKELLNSAKNRFAVLDILIAKHPMKGDKTMVFHESVPEIKDLVERFSYMNPLEYHYKVGGKKAKMEVLDNFKAGKSNLLFSCRALTEGFNIPDAQVGIMVSGTRSVRSRIQTLGRLLRGSQATVYFIYVPNTKDSRGLSNLIGKGGVPQENVEYWKFDSETRNMVKLSESKQSKIQDSMASEYDKTQSYENKKTHGRLECKHCGRGSEKAKSKPFKTPNGLKYHMERSCRDAPKGIYRCAICSKAFKHEENRNACLDECASNPPCVGRMSFDDFMDGFKSRDKLHDVSE